MPRSNDFGEIFAGGSVDPIPVGFRSGTLVHVLRITGADPGTGTVPDGIDAQLKNAFRSIKSSIESAGGTLDNVAHVSLFLTNSRADMPAVNREWVEVFPDAADRPTYKFMNCVLPAGQLVAIEYFAVLGARRSVINIEGVAHTNPIPMGVKIGNHLFSSRVLPADPSDGSYPKDVGAQLDCLFANVASVLAAAQMKWADVVQGRLFLADLATLPLVQSRWSSLFPDESRRPKLHPTAYSVSPSLLVMLEIIAAQE